jgi:hypothetical protein
VQLLLSLPKAVLVFLALFVSLMVIMIISPPHTPCQSQLEVFRNNQTGFLYLDKKKSYMKTTGYQKSVEVCKYGNSPGACLDFFSGIKQVVKDLEFMPSECAGDVTSESIVNSAVWESIELMVQLSWGNRAPSSYLERQGWLDTYHLGVFCDLKRLLVTSYGKDRWNQFVNTQLKNLPQAQQLSRNESWQRSILSFSCETL